MFFKPNLPDEKFQNWCKEAISFLSTKLDEGSIDKIPDIVLPNDEFYPFLISSDTYHEDMMNATKKYMGMHEWPCNLIVQEDSAFDTFANQGLEFRSSNPAGYIESDGKEIKITINERTARNSFALIATMAHELSHYLLFSIEGHDQWGHEVEEYLTDLCAIYHGFGIFLFKSAFIETNEGGIFGMSSTSRQGYMNKVEILYTMAQIMKLKNLDPMLFKNFMGSESKTIKKIISL